MGIKERGAGISTHVYQQNRKRALVMGIWGLAGTYAGVTDPQWHAVLKIIVGLVAVAVGFMEKEQ